MYWLLSCFLLKKVMAQKIHTNPYRKYRKALIPKQGEISFQVMVEETDMQVVALTDISQKMLHEVSVLRGIIKNTIAMYPDFATSLTPVEAPAGVPAVIQAMCRAAKQCHVGPMAAVAGAMAQFTAQAVGHLSQELLIENGGDLWLQSSCERTVAVLADPQQKAGVGLLLSPKDFPLSLCASSATIGHSLSFGQGELVVTRSGDACLADAAATALCNMLVTAKDLHIVTTQAEKMGLDGVFAQCQGHIAAWGNMELTALAESSF